jgi:hemerythrin
MELKKVVFEPMNDIHNQEIKILNKLISKIENKENLEEIYNEFLEDVKNHFTFEEELMEKYNFFAKLPHKLEHQRVLNELNEIKEKLNDYDFLEKYFKENFLPWLKNHVETMDTVTAGFFNMVNAQK